MRTHSLLIAIAVVTCTGCRMLDTYFPPDAGYPPPPAFEPPVLTTPGAAYPANSYPQSSVQGAPATSLMPPANAGSFPQSEYQPYQPMPNQPAPTLAPPMNNGSPAPSGGAVPSLNYYAPPANPHSSQRSAPSVRTASTVSHQQQNADAVGTWQTLATSVEGRPIQYRTTGSGEFRVLVVGSLHGDETNGVALLDQLSKCLNQPENRPAETSVYLIRDANPDGRLQRRRENANRVDLNHNFATTDWRKITRGSGLISGRQPHSEPESQAVADWILKAQPQRIVLFTSQSATGAVSYAGGASGLAEQFSRLGATRVVRPAAEETSGSLLSFADEKQIPVLVIDLPRYAQLDELWARYREPLLTTLTPNSLEVSASGSGPREAAATHVDTRSVQSERSGGTPATGLVGPVSTNLNARQRPRSLPATALPQKPIPLVADPATP